METAAGLIKLKPGVKAAVDDWRATLQERVDEAVATLKDEGVQIESWFEIDVNGEKYLLWYMRAESIARVWDVAMQSRHDIDAYHFKVMADITAQNGEISAKSLLDLCSEDFSG